ncbi:hypothetical protein UlMin_030289 [Ulmus minor]
MKNFGYKQSNSDHTLFLKHQKGKIAALIIYVDDMVVTGDDQEEIESLQRYLASEFEMKQLGDLKYFLGIEVARSKNGIFLSQRKYILDLLAETGMLGCKPTKTPIEQNHKLFLCLDATSTDKARYQRLVGKLIYLSHTRPDIAYAVCVVEGYTDADWAGSADNRRSTSGYFTFVGGNLVTWRSKKQPVVARLATKYRFNLVFLSFLLF